MSIRSMLSNIYGMAKDLRYFLLRDELGCPIKVPLWTRMRMLSQGFLGYMSVVYDFSKYDRRDYITNHARVRMSRRLHTYNMRARYDAALDNKLFFTAIMKPYLRVADIYAFITRGNVVSTCNDLHFNVNLYDFVLSTGQSLVLKSVTGAEGHGVVVLRRSGSGVLMNNEAVSHDELNRIISNLDEFIVCEYLHQSSWSAGLYPNSVNTMRVLTFRDPDTNESFIGAAVHRIGTDRSAPVDNWSQGSLSCNIDLETGELGPGATFPYSGKMIWHERHPDTNAPIAGERIPNWDAAKEQLLQVVRQLPYLTFIAWDLIVTDDGLAAIEGNATTGVILFQMHKPLLIDKRIRRYFEYHRVV